MNYFSSKIKQQKQEKEKLKIENQNLLEMIHWKNDINDKLTASWKREIKKRHDLEEKVKGATVFVKSSTIQRVKVTLPDPEPEQSS